MPVLPEQIERDKGDRHVRGRSREQIRSFTFPTQPFLQVKKCQLLAVLERHDFAVEDQFVLELSGLLGELVELIRHAPQIARKYFHASRASVELGANAVELVFHVDCSRRRDAGPQSATAATANRAQIASAVGSGLASMHLIGRNSDSSARCNSPLKASSAVSPMSPRSMFASFTSSSERAERRGDGFLHETLAQTDPEIAGQDLDHILSFARREFGEARLENFSLGQRASGFV